MSLFNIMYGLIDSVVFKFSHTCVSLDLFDINKGLVSITTWIP